jgi:hypothetical protein
VDKAVDSPFTKKVEKVFERSVALVVGGQTFKDLGTFGQFIARVLRAKPDDTEAQALQKNPLVSSLQTYKLIRTYTNADNCLVAFCTWNPTTTGLVRYVR